MQRRELLGMALGTLVLSATGCSAARTVANSGSVVVSGLSAREAREIGRKHRMLGQLALSSSARRSLQPGEPLPANLALREIPAAMLADLPQVAGHEWRIAGVDLLLVNSSTMLVADILRAPLR